MNKCNCDLCESNRKIRARINGMLPEYRGFVEYLWERALEAEADNDYYKAVLKGEWPSSEEMLKDALSKFVGENK